MLSASPLRHPPQPPVQHQLPPIPIILHLLQRINIANPRGVVKFSRRSPRMCKTKMAIDAAEPIRTPKRSQTPKTPPPYSSDPSTSTPGSGFDYASTTSGGFKLSSDTASVVSSGASLSSLRQSLPENPIIYEFSELRAATNNFLARRHSSSATASWRCSLRGKDAIVFQRKFRRKIELNRLKDLLGAICRSHLSGIVKLLGASVSGENVYLAYEFVDGACLSDCLRSQRNPNFTVLKTWMSRMQIATDIAHALDYIHNNTGLNISLVHNHIKSSSIVVTEPNFNAKICHFGAAQLCGEINENETIGDIVEEPRGQLSRSNSRVMQFEGVRGYMSPEFRASGVGTQKSDVYAFGVVILELLSGEEPFKYRFDKAKGDFTRTSVIETAQAAVDDGGGGGGTVAGRLRQWVDRRLSDSFPVEAAERLIRVALECVEEDPEKRPDMARVAGKISKLYVQSKSWSENFKVPNAISVSFVPR